MSKENGRMDIMVGSQKKMVKMIKNAQKKMQKIIVREVKEAMRSLANPLAPTGECCENTFLLHERFIGAMLGDFSLVND